ncbi:MAG: hypothetical protein JSU63_19985 [Phycisphaerales bacterium]|nr:MAG: hypothetical protein JSU63_19985 [Phycisphaerales bacterium]
MDTTTFWSRLRRFFNSAGDTIEGDGEAIADRRSALETTDKRGGGAPCEQRPTDSASPSAITPRDSDTDRMEEAYTRIIDLVASIREHLELQDRRAEHMAPTLDRLAQGLADIPEAAKAQVDLLSKMSGLLEGDIESAKRIEAALSQLPHIADAQRETMVSMGRQLDVLREASDSETTTLDELRKGFSELAEAANASTSTLRQIHVDKASQEKELAQLLQEQARRLTVFAGVAVVLAFLAALIGLVALLR